MNITNEQIEAAKANTNYTTGKPHHEHPDCIRIAVEWLEAQKRLKNPSFGRGGHPLKHIIESWAGRYVSRDDVEVAANILGLQGAYPYFNISSRLTRPNLTRIQGIDQAMTHKIYLGKYDHAYALMEGELQVLDFPPQCLPM